MAEAGSGYVYNHTKQAGRAYQGWHLDQPADIDWNDRRRAREINTYYGSTWRDY